MSDWEPAVRIARRAAARLLLAHRAGLVTLPPDGEYLCLDACSSPHLKRVLRLKIGRTWLALGSACPSAGLPGAPKRPDERDEDLAGALDRPATTG